MKRILLAMAAVIGFATTAAAQDDGWSSTFITGIQAANEAFILASLTGQPAAKVPAFSWLLANHPTSDGGIGLRDVSDTAPTRFLIPLHPLSSHALR